MKKLFFLIIILLLFFLYPNERIETVFSYNEDEAYDLYKINFEECILNTDNFVEKFSYFSDKDFKILEIIPYKDYNHKFLFYSNNPSDTINKFKNDYNDVILKNEMYTNNVCIKSVKINTSNYILNGFKNIISFYY